MGRLNTLSPILPDTLFSLFTEFAKAWIRGGQTTRRLFILGIASGIIAAVIAVLGESALIPVKSAEAFAVLFGVGAGLILVGIVVYRRALDEKAFSEEFRNAEEHARAHPEKPRAAWEIAQIKLESYLNRNLSHIRWIFVLTLIVMLFGFVIIGYGIIQIYDSPENLKPSIVVAGSGVLIEFIAATFLVIYRSTMTQAQSYVNVLERINAVGMSLQILEGIEEENPELRDKARADLAKELLTLYARTGSKDA